MLNDLVHYADRQGLNPEPGFERKEIKWLICCTDKGQYSGVVSLGEGKGRLFPFRPVTPGMVAGGRSHFLAETLDTIALLVDQQKDNSKSRIKHRYFCDLLDKAGDAIPIPLFKVASRMLQDEVELKRLQKELAEIKAKPTDLATLRIGEVIPLEQTDWHDWWRAFRSSLVEHKKTGKTTQHSRCLVTGEIVEPALTHPKIRGLAGVGGMPAGDVVVGFDKDAFTSYGFEQSQNAAMSEQTAAAYAAALNHLIAEKSVKLGNTMSVYWYRESVIAEDDPLEWLREPPEQEAASAELKARQLLTAIQEGKRPDLANNRYHALLLSGAAGRVMVREVIQGSFETLVTNIRRWFDDLAIVAREGKGLAPAPKFLAVAGSLVRDLKDLPSPLLQQLWRSAVTGNDIPYAAMAQATLRARIDVISDQSASHARMGLLKAFNVRKGDIHMQPHLNPDHPHPAYHCGRLLAVLARLQRAALGEVCAGVVQRYYTAASQTPGLIVGRLVANAKNHLGKLEGGQAHWYESQIAEVMSRMGNAMPTTLTLEEQSLFALGYYQQLAALNAGKGKNSQDIAP